LTPTATELAVQLNQNLSIDFVADNLFDVRKLRMPTLVDRLTRASLDIQVVQRLTGQDVVHDSKWAGYCDQAQPCIPDLKS
jgi:hypothetical protein